jgi:hypothetical protein
MESKAMVAVQESWPVSGASLPVGEPVTLVIEDERFFGWVAPEAHAHSLVCVAIEFAQFITLCSSSNLAEARHISSPWQGSSPAKT